MTTFISQSEDIPVKGDIDGDGDLDLRDVEIALQVLAGQIPPDIRGNYAVSGADVNGDSRVGLEELIYIKERISGLRSP